MDLFIVVYRTLFFYIFILIIYRIMGKREVGQLSVQDLVVSVLIAEMVAISIENKEDTLILTVIPIIALVILEILANYVALRFNKFRNIIEGKPALIINKGKINFKEMVKQRYTLDDLLMELSDVEYAVLENNGKLSVFKYNFLKIKSENPFPLILDGVIQKSTLKYINKTESWLKDLIGDTNPTEVFYCFYKNNKAYIIKKEDVKK